MAGHSKWATTKRHKAAMDQRRGKLFSKLSRMISVAAREGGGDPAANVRLRLAVEKARAANMPAENIERAIKRGTGELEGVAYEAIRYEGYGVGGVAVMVDVLTDNRNRTAGELRHLFSRNGGNLGESGCVAWMFEARGTFVLERARLGLDEDDLLEIALEAGADDVEWGEDEVVIVCAPDQFHEVKENLEAREMPIQEAEITMEPTNAVEVPVNEAARVIRLLEALEDHDDVQAVYTNAELPDEALEMAQQ